MNFVLIYRKMIRLEVRIMTRTEIDEKCIAEWADSICDTKKLER